MGGRRHYRLNAVYTCPLQPGSLPSRLCPLVLTHHPPPLPTTPRPSLPHSLPPRTSPVVQYWNALGHVYRTSMLRVTPEPVTMVAMRSSIRWRGWLSRELWKPSDWTPRSGGSTSNHILVTRGIGEGGGGVRAFMTIHLDTINLLTPHIGTITP